MSVNAASDARKKHNMELLKHHRILSVLLQTKKFKKMQTEIVNQKNVRQHSTNFGTVEIITKSKSVINNAKQLLD